MDEFDYMNGTLHEWALESVPGYNGVLVDLWLIQNEYLPRFEQAIYKNITEKMSGKVL